MSFFARGRERDYSTFSAFLFNICLKINYWNIEVWLNFFFWLWYLLIYWVSVFFLLQFKIVYSCIWPKELSLYVIISRCHSSGAECGISCGNPLHLACLLQKMIYRFLYLKIFMISKYCLNLLIKSVYPTRGYPLDCKSSFLVLKISVWLIMFYHVNIYETIIVFYSV